MTSNVFPMSYIDPSSCPALGLFSIVDASLYLIFFPQQLFQSHSPLSYSALGSCQLVFIAYYLGLIFLLMYSSLSTDVFPNKTNINITYYNIVIVNLYSASSGEAPLRHFRPNKTKP